MAQTSFVDDDEIEVRDKIISAILVLGAAISEVKNDVANLFNDIGTYKQRYAVPLFAKHVKKQKETELTSHCQKLDKLLPITNDKPGLELLKKTYMDAFACSLQCYQDAHVAFAAEKSRLEEEERERKRKEEEERLEKERLEKEALEKAAKEEEERLERERIAEERKKKAQELYEQKKAAGEEVPDEIREDPEELEEKKEEKKEPEVPKVPLTPFELERQVLKRQLVEQEPTNMGTLVFNVYDTIEKFTAERIILIGKHLQMDEEEIVNLLQVNQKLADKNRRNIKRSQRPREKVEKSLHLSGLM